MQQKKGSPNYWIAGELNSRLMRQRFDQDTRAGIRALWRSFSGKEGTGLLRGSCFRLWKTLIFLSY